MLYTWSLPIVLLWLGAAGVLNLAVPQLETVIKQHARSFLPDDAASVQAIAKMGDHFGGAGTNNFVYLLLEGDEPLGTEAHRYYSLLLDDIGQDTTHVNSMMDLWSNPQFAPANESADGKVAYVLLNLAGNMGTARAMESTQAVRDIIAAHPAPPGVTAHLTGPSAVVNDELVAINDSILLLLIACGALVGAILFWVYRSPFTVAMPMLVAGAGLGVGRPIVAFLGSHHVIGVSIFASALMAVMVLGAGIDYGIFLLGRYQEARRAGEDPTTAYYTALRGTQHIIIASGLTIAGATACMTFTRLAMFSTAGLPCTIAVVVTLAAALTLGPATLALGSRFGLFEPRADNSLRRWRRIATYVVRWPGPVLVGAMAVLGLALLVLPTFQPSYNERAAQPSTSPANLGFAAADRHLPPNIMAPSVFLVEADHDMRNPADLIALAKLTNALLDIRGVSNVQGITRPLGAPLDQSTLTSQAGYIGGRLSQMSALLGQRVNDLIILNAEVGQLELTLRGVEQALGTGAIGMNQIGSSATELKESLTAMVAKLDSVRDAVGPAQQFLDSLPDCRANQYCRTAATGFTVFDDLHRFDDLVDGVVDGSRTVAQTLPELSNQLVGLKEFVAQVKAVVTPVRDALAILVPQVSEITEFTDELRTSFAAGDPNTSFFLPSQAFDSPLYKEALPFFFSADGTMTRMVITPEMEGFSRAAMDVSAEVIPTALQAIKGTSLAGSTVSLGGPGGTLLNIEAFAREDFLTSAVAAFAFVFCVILLLLRSLVAAIAVIGTVALSYLSALGLSAFVWQDLIGNPLHWSVAPVSFVFLVAVGADYNMLLVARFKEELGAGIKTGIIRAMVNTGGVVTTAGLVFGFTMLAMLVGYAHNIAQIGTTVGLGLLLDTVVVRSLVIPAIATLAGRWFWWPIVVHRPSQPHGAGTSHPSTPIQDVGANSSS
ncbi:RND family transporter [Mycolicibacter sp. MYC340]|uniref:RND family transporter n=1 Tax=[Mycobacterium] nativiensis TaxID=2855503 RepID=A0ABU5XSD0_9MYCO|nr:RND family transporter [Mycolicibacter sp. MYC340]MEB3030657.1 RND family transporter [Mycolicibacter sp. MYC340]